MRLCTSLSAVLVLWFFVEPRGSMALTDPGQALALVIFVAICLSIAFVTEALRRALERVAAGEHGKDLLLREINHRVRNDLQGLTSALAVEQRRAASPEARSGLQRVAERVRLMSRVYGRLLRRESQAVIEAQAFLEDLAADLRVVHLAERPVTLEARIEDVELSLDCAAALGLIVNELLTNAAKHAFPDDRPGRIELVFGREGESLVLTIGDDGIGQDANAHHGRGQGHHLVQALAKQLEGEVEIKGNGGTRVRIQFPERCAFDR